MIGAKQNANLQPIHLQNHQFGVLWFFILFYLQNIKLDLFFKSQICDPEEVSHSILRST